MIQTPASDVLAELRSNLSKEALLLVPGDEKFVHYTQRWSSWQPPTFGACVVASEEDDISKTIVCAKANNIPFMATTGRHGDYAGMTHIQDGIQIDLSRFKKVEVCSDGQHAIIGAGVISKDVTDALWAAGKVTVTGICETTGIGLWLGGGHGILQGSCGLATDQIVEARIVLGDGSITTVSETDKPDLLWALKGAGQSFGVITEMKIRVYDAQPFATWSNEVRIFKGDQLEDVFNAVNAMTALQTPTDHCFAVFQNIPDVDPENTIITVVTWSTGDPTTSHLSNYSQPLHALTPAVHQSTTFSYPEHPKLFAVDVNAPLSVKGRAYMRHAIDVRSHDIPATRRAYDIFNAALKANPAFATHSTTFFEGYPVHAVQAVPDESTAYPWRADPWLLCPFFVYPHDPTLDDAARAAGTAMRRAFWDGSGRDELHVYPNYANGDEAPQCRYGYEPWRLERLRELKNRYDPDNLFRFYGDLIDWYGGISSRYIDGKGGKGGHDSLSHDGD